MPLTELVVQRGLQVDVAGFGVDSEVMTARRQMVDDATVGASVAVFGVGSVQGGSTHFALPDGYADFGGSERRRVVVDVVDIDVDLVKMRKNDRYNAKKLANYFC